MNNFKSFIGKNGSLILSVLSSIGVVGTAILSAKATHDAEKRIRVKDKENSSKKEKILTAIPYYLPTILIGSSTILCISGIYIFNKRQQESLTAAYALISNSYREYRDKLVELKGNEADEEILVGVASEKFPDWKIPENKTIFYDAFSKRYFVSDLASVVSAAYHFNRSFQLRGAAPMNEFYSFLGIDGIEFGDVIGYNSNAMIEDGLTPWIDIHTIKAEVCDGTEFYIIDYDWDPLPNYEEWESQY